MPEVSISEHARKTRHPGRLFLVTAPSGAGKSSLVNALLARQPNNFQYHARPEAR